MINPDDAVGKENMARLTDHFKNGRKLARGTTLATDTFRFALSP